MFDQSYPFNFIHTQAVQGEPFFKVHLFKFRAKDKLVYLVRLEEFEHDFFSVKFHLKQHTYSDKKYEMLTGKQEAARIINTCLLVMGDMLNRHPKASFGFTGAPVGEEAGQSEPTKRFRIYRRIMENFFSPENFAHYQLPDKNAYFLLNKKHENPSAIAAYITDLLRKNYYF